MTLPVFDPNDHFASLVLGQADPSRSFEPQVYVSEDGDCVEFFVSSDDFYAERIDSFVTIYYSRATKKIIGSIIKGVKAYVQAVLTRSPGFKVEFGKGTIKLHRLFTAHLWFFPDGEQSLKYEQLRDLAESSGVAIDESGLCPSH